MEYFLKNGQITRSDQIKKSWFSGLATFVLKYGQITWSDKIKKRWGFHGIATFVVCPFRCLP
jgi:hypothetical protein